MRPLYLAVLLTAALGLSSCDGKSHSALAQERRLPPNRIEGSFTVSFKALVGSVQENNATALTFYDQYVVMETKTGGRLLSTNAIGLSWERNQ